MWLLRHNARPSGSFPSRRLQTFAAKRSRLRLMKRAIASLALSVACCAAPQPVPDRHDKPVELSRGVVGPPRRCVTLDQLGSLRVSETDPHLLVYASGQILWANYVGQCGFGRDDVLVTEPTGSELCTGDIVRSFDRESHIAGPSCVLGEFVPYRR